MKSQITRRKFLYAATVSLGALTVDQLLIACGANNVVPQPAATNTKLARPTATTAATATAQPAATQVAATETVPPTVTSVPTKPDLVVARTGEPEALVRRALAALGGMERFVSRDANVIIKPNICVAYHTFEYAATTNPWVVGALVKMCFEAGARSVRVMDYPFGGSAEEAYAISGIADQVKAAGGEMVVMPQFKFVATDIPQGKSLKRTNIFEDALKADVLIDVPIAKHHSLSRLTLAMKNLMGLIADRPAMHANLGQRLADLTSRVHPALTVVDAVRILVDHGPTGGDLNDVKQLDTVIASPDIVAADSYAATLFGLKPADLAYIKAGAAMGLGRSDLKSLRIEELNVGA